MNFKSATACAILALTPSLSGAQQFMYSCKDSTGNIEFGAERKAGMSCEAIGATITPRWKHVGTSADGNVLIRVDQETISRDSNDSVSIWVQYIFLRSRSYVNGGYVARTMQREQIDCARMSSGVTSFISYSEDSKVLANATYPSALPTPIVPDSIAEAVWSSLCKG